MIIALKEIGFCVRQKPIFDRVAETPSVPAAHHTQVLAAVT